MNLEKQVCGLRLAESLKQVGVKQESLFYWIREYTVDNYNDNNIVWLLRPANELSETISYQKKEHLSAFTACELGEMLPRELRVHFPDDDPNDWFYYTSSFVSRKNERYWEISYEYTASPEGDQGVYIWDKAITEVDARAKMLLRLIKSKCLIL